MIELIKHLADSLNHVFEEKLTKKHLRYFDDDNIDLLQTTLCLSKTQKEFREIFDLSSVTDDYLRFNYKNLVDETIKNKFIKYCQKPNENRLHLTCNGLYYYYLKNDLNINNVFIGYDDYRFPLTEYRLKTEEKIWCLYLILLGAYDEENKLDTNNFDQDQLTGHFNFLSTIEKQIHKNEIDIGKAIGWGMGKKKNFRQYITTLDALPKTGLYHNLNKTYWLNLGTIEKAKYLLDLILDNYDTEIGRLNVHPRLYNALWDLQGKMLPEIGRTSPQINDNLKEILF